MKVAETELKPCPNPWCAATMKPLLVTEVDPEGQNIGLKVMCFYDCNLSGPVRPTEAEAVAAWNQRPSPQPDQETVERLEEAGAAAYGQGYEDGFVDAHVTDAEWPDEEKVKRQIDSTSRSDGWQNYRETFLAALNPPPGIGGEVEKLRAAVAEVMPYLEWHDTGDHDDHEPVGWDGVNQRPLPLTFGMIRRLRAAHAALSTPDQSGDEE
jgi:hypothetical protein